MNITGLPGSAGANSYYSIFHYLVLYKLFPEAIINPKSKSFGIIRD